jgi:hypothetical protein
VTRILAAAFVLWSACAAYAQQPFPTDDADVTAAGKFHYESFDEFDWLQTSQLPHLRQNTFNMKVNYGLGHGLELDLDSPLLAIVNDHTSVPRVPFGLGDTNFGIKWNFKEEHDGSRAPALTVVNYIEFPTGDSAHELGSGLLDVWVYGVIQKTLRPNLVLHVNGGWLFHGNTATGVVGIITAHGHVATMGGSLVRKINDKVTVGVDMTGAYTHNAFLERDQFQATVGANYGLADNLTLDLGVIAGHFEASPRLGVQIGFSWDIKAEPQASSASTSAPSASR